MSTDTLDLSLTEEEKYAIVVNIMEDRGRTSDDPMTAEEVIALVDAVADAATAKAAYAIVEWLNHISVRGGSGWDFGESLEKHLTAAGIQKPEGAR